jgi:hypothetical protein
MSKGLGPIRTTELGIRNGLPAKEPERGLEGVAWGGPKHGIRLTAGIRWDGCVLMTKDEAKYNKLSSQYQHYHHGRYEWQPMFSFSDYTWVWIPLNEPPKKPIRRESQPSTS